MAKQGYILTLFSDDIIQTWQAMHHSMWDTGKITYIGSQLEVCPKTGRAHWQAFVWFSKAEKQRGTWFKMFGAGIHFTPVTALRAGAINYGTKDATRLLGCVPLTNGVAPKAPENEWEDLQKAVSEKDKTLVPFKLLVRYNLEKRFDGICSFGEVDNRTDVPYYLPNPWGKIIIGQKRNLKQRHYWIFSRQPNLGKTHFFAKPVHEKYKSYLHVGAFTYMGPKKSDQLVILDEYNTAKLSWDSLNAMCDGTWQYRQIYGVPYSICDPVIIVLSNQALSDLYPHMNQTLYARFIEIELF